MPAIASRGRGRRRAMNEINMVPFIDVMFVLLIIFMVCAPMITPGMVDLPSVGRAKQQPTRVVEVVVVDEGTLKLRVDGRDFGSVPLRQLAERVKTLQAEAPGEAEQVPVVISARKDVRYEEVVKVMDRLQRGGVKRVGLSVRATGAAVQD